MPYNMVRSKLCGAGLDKKSEGERTILVFHFGGATYDLTLLTLDDGLFEVIATGGDSHLGELCHSKILLRWHLHD
jgi:molecular chaperone DnaK (HSP70)